MRPFYFQSPLAKDTFARAFDAFLMDILLSWNWIGLGFIIALGIGLLIQLYYFFGYFRRVNKGTNPPPTGEVPPVTVVIAARNEEKNLMEHIPIIMDQDHPNFEVVVINDSSWDDTQEILKALSVSYPNIHVINLDEEKQNMQGKKFALTLGIKAAKHDTIVLTDADCVPHSKQWLRTIAAGINEKTQMVLGFSPYYRKPGWLNKIIRFDTFMIGLHYLGIAKAGHPYMGVGRNLVYSRELFFKVGGFKNHYSIASGDDDLFVNQVATKHNTITEYSPESQTFSAPKEGWNDWFAQKRRHFITAPLYKSTDKNRLALWPLGFLLFWTGLIGALVFKTLLLVVVSIFLMRYIIQMSILHGASKRLGLHKDIVWLAPFLELHLHVLNAGLYFSNLVRKPQKWN